MAHAYNLTGWGPGFAELDRVPQRSEPVPADSVDLSGALRMLIARQGVKQAAIAWEMRLDASVISLWVKGRRPVPGSRIEALARALYVSVAELLSYAPHADSAGAADTPSYAFADLAVAPPPPVIQPLPSAPPAYELCCMLCGRGTGPAGTLVRIREVPLRVGPCTHCGGFMLCDEIPPTAMVLMEREHHGSRYFYREREVA